MRRISHPTLDLIAARKAAGSRPGRRADPHRLGLAVEGGGMRGVVSAGMVSGIEALGLRDCFDVVVGTSAGGFNAAYFVAGQAAYGTTIYYESINSKRFIDPLRPLTGKPIMSLEYLVDHVSQREKILDCRGVIDSPIPLYLIVAPAHGTESVALGGFKAAAEIREALRASARLPLVAGPPVEIDGELYFDGGVMEPIPYRTAARLGCTHVLTLLTRQITDHYPSIAAWRLAVCRRLLRRYPRMYELMETRKERYDRAVRDLVDLARAPVEPPYFYALYPGAESAVPSRLETDRARLLDAAIGGMKTAIEVLSGETPSVHEILRPFDDRGVSL